MKLTKVHRTAGWLAVAGLLGAALITPGAALATANYATVDGHQAFSPEANHADYWGKHCDKYVIPEDVKYDDYVISQNYDLIVVKAGSGEFANTIFSNVKGGQTVWADTNGNNKFDAGGQDGDKNISHIIYCGPDETTATETSTTTDETTNETSTTTDDTSTTTDETTSTTTDETTSTTTDDTTSTTTDDTSTTTTFSGETTSTTSTGSVSAETGTKGDPTPPSTDTSGISSTSTTTGGGWQLLLVALSGLLAAALLLTPAAARKR
jgi:hypothetical protein